MAPNRPRAPTRPSLTLLHSSPRQPSASRDRFQDTRRLRRSVAAAQPLLTYARTRVDCVAPHSQTLLAPSTTSTTATLFKGHKEINRVLICVFYADQVKTLSSYHQARKTSRGNTDTASTQPLSDRCVGIDFFLLHEPIRNPLT